MTDNTLISMRRALPASAARAFAAWTDADVVRQWWGGWEAGTAPAMTSDLRVGGAWRFAMNFDGKTQWVSGTYLEVDEAAKRVVFDFTWEGGEQPKTPVTLVFVDQADGTCELQLDHDQSAGGNACEEGWGWSIGCLADLLGRSA